MNDRIIYWKKEWLSNERIMDKFLFQNVLCFHTETCLHNQYIECFKKIDIIQI